MPCSRPWGQGEPVCLLFFLLRDFFFLFVLAAFNCSSTFILVRIDERFWLWVPINIQGIARETTARGSCLEWTAVLSDHCCVFFARCLPCSRVWCFFRGVFRVFALSSSSYSLVRRTRTGTGCTGCTDFCHVSTQSRDRHTWKRRNHACARVVYTCVPWHPLAQVVPGCHSSEADENSDPKTC